MPDVLNGKFAQTRMEVTSTATAIPATALDGRVSMLIKNMSSKIIYLGNSDVTAGDAGDGFPLEPGDVFPIEIGEQLVLYGRVASGIAVIKVLEGS